MHCASPSNRQRLIAAISNGSWQQWVSGSMESAVLVSTAQDWLTSRHFTIGRWRTSWRSRPRWADVSEVRWGHVLPSSEGELITWEPFGIPMDLRAIFGALALEALRLKGNRCNIKQERIQKASLRFSITP